MQTVKSLDGIKTYTVKYNAEKGRLRVSVRESGQCGVAAVVIIEHGQYNEYSDKLSVGELETILNGIVGSEEDSCHMRYIIASVILKEARLQESVAIFSQVEDMAIESSMDAIESYLEAYSDESEQYKALNSAWCGLCDREMLISSNAWVAES